MNALSLKFILRIFHLWLEFIPLIHYLFGEFAMILLSYSRFHHRSTKINMNLLSNHPVQRKLTMKHHLSRQSLNSIYKLWTSLSAPWSHFESTLYFHKFTINPLSITRVDFYICFAKWSWIKKITIDWLFISRIHAESTVYFANTLNPLSVWRI